MTHWGVVVLSVEYYRRQAEILLAVCLLGADRVIEEALIAKALEFLEKVEEGERGEDVSRPAAWQR
jgi:hypothetical protein